MSLIKLAPFILDLTVAFALGVVAQVPPKIISFELSSSKAISHCPFPKHIESECNAEQAMIKLKLTLTKSSEKLQPIFIVSTGIVKRDGLEYVWDLTNSPPGDHVISVGLERNGVIVGDVLTKTLQMAICSVCDLPCSCPTFSVSGPNGTVSAGDHFVVRVNVVGALRRTAPKWAIEGGGRIVNGNYTDSVLIKTSAEDKGKTITVTVDIGDVTPGCNCNSEASETIIVN